MVVYTSSYAPTAPPSSSIFSYLLSPTHPRSTYSQHPPSAPAFIDAASGRVLTRAALRSLALQLAHSLAHPPAPLRPLARGDTALVFSPNSLAWPIALLGLVAAGATVSPANPAYTPTELAHQYTDSRAGLVLVHPDFVDAVFEMLRLVGVGEDEARARVVVMSYEGRTGKPQGLSGRLAQLVWLEELLGHGEKEREELFDGDLTHETLYLCYSSGTTGKPKGVMTTHLNMISVNLMLSAVVNDLKPASDKLIAVLPYYHIYGLVNLLHFPLLVNVPAVILPRFEPSAFCAAIARYRVTVAMIVPPILLTLVHHPATTQHDITSLQYLSSGAAPVGRQLMAAAVQKLGSVGANVVIGQGYGLTETSPVTHHLPRALATRKPGSCGLLLPNLEARLVDEDGEAPEWDDKEERVGGPGVRVSGRGELWLRGPNVMKGYLNNEAATRNALTSDGWFKTGDIAVRDAEGFWYIVDRKKELIKYKGFQVAPAELEAILLTHPQLVDVAVIGVQDDVQATELPRAYVVPASKPADPAAFARGVQDWLGERVAYHKKLRGGVVLVDAIPKSASGKILRRELRDRAKAERAAEVAAGPVKAKL
ncbi:acetyl-CoA synthetase-like protein [Dentipellis sp. KUC8613]|nr:acetyl-CoA synthetase-like protein [Dentipellis sp. KUC8613]